MKKEDFLPDEEEVFDEIQMAEMREFMDNIGTNKSNDKRYRGKGYKRMHTKKGGAIIPIAAMDNKHLENTINLFIEAMKSMKSQALYDVGETGDMFNLELNGIQKMDKETAIKKISDTMYHLEPYFTELVIRGNTAYIMRISEALEELLGRKKISSFGNKLLKENNKLMTDIDKLRMAKLEIVSEAVTTSQLNKLQDSGFFTVIGQIFRSKKVKTHNRIWLGRQLKEVFDGSAPNPGGLAIFQAPDEFKKIREWERKQS